eukprot:1124809_1
MWIPGLNYQFGMPIENSSQFNLETFEIIVRGSAHLDTLDINHKYEFLSQLKGFALSTSELSKGRFIRSLNALNRLMAVMYRSITNKLESFHNGYAQITTALNGKLNGLKEICLHLNRTDNVSEAILLQQNWRNLQRMYLKYFEINRSLMDKMVRNVKYIAFDISKEEHNSYVGLDNLLYSLVKVRKETLKVRWERMVCDDDFDVMYVDRMVNILNNNCADWMLIGYHWKFAKSKDIFSVSQVLICTHPAE